MRTIRLRLRTRKPLVIILFGSFLIIFLKLYQDVQMYHNSNKRPMMRLIEDYEIHANQDSGIVPDIMINNNSFSGTVLFIWCEDKQFEFRHYLSLMSAIYFLQPDSVEFYYRILPRSDKESYNTWFDEITGFFPFLIIRDMKFTKGLCKNQGTQMNVQNVRSLILKRSALYVNHEVILSKQIFTISKNPPKYQISNITYSMASAGHSEIMCKDVSYFELTHKAQICVKIGKSYFPRDIWYSEDKFGSLARTLFYGHPEIRRPVPNYKTLVPNIAHYVWMGGGDMNYMFYLSVLSLIYIVKVDQVYIHGDSPPGGEHWKKLQSNSKVTYVFRENPGSVYGVHVGKVYHISDILRVHLMLEYGGIYTDTDVLFVRPYDMNLRAFDAVAALDWTRWNKPFPDILNLGVALGKPNTTYWKLLLDSMRGFRDRDYSWNGLRQPYKIYERNPHLLHVEPHLQVLCWKLRCHPTWKPNYHKEANNHLVNPMNWKTDSYSYHLTTYPDELIKEKNLLASKTMFAEIGRYILRKADIIE